MVQAITGHSSALAGRSISYYSMKLTFSLQTSVPLPQRGRPSLCFEKKRIGGGRGNEGWRELKRERERENCEKGKTIGTIIGSKTRVQSLKALLYGCTWKLIFPVCV